MSEQRKKRQRTYDFGNAETKTKKNPEISAVSLWSPSGPHLNTLPYALLGVLEKTNVTPAGEEWNKMSEEFI